MISYFRTRLATEQRLLGVALSTTAVRVVRVQISLGLHHDAGRKDRCKHWVSRSVSDLYGSRRTACSGRRPSDNLCGYDQLLGSRTPGQYDVRRQYGVLHRRPCRIQHRREGESIEVSASSLALPFQSGGLVGHEIARCDPATVLLVSLSRHHSFVRPREKNRDG